MIPADTRTNATALVQYIVQNVRIRDTHIMLKILPILLFPNSFDFILLFLKFSTIIPKIIPRQVKPKAEKIRALFNSYYCFFKLIYNLHRN